MYKYWIKLIKYFYIVGGGVVVVCISVYFVLTIESDNTITRDPH